MRERGRLSVAAAAATLAIVSARPYAGSWNDGSRLATVEALVDQHTWAIDRSIFVIPAAAASPPYDPGRPALMTTGTLDKLRIGDHFYSDKSPVPALVLAAEYLGMQRAFRVVARDRPSAFCYWLTLGSSGLAYFAACIAMFVLARRALPSRGALAVTASFGLATFAPAYARHVNGHIVLLAIVAWLMVLWDDLNRASRPAALTAFGIGLLTGAGYGVDSGVAPALLVSSAALVAGRGPATAVACFLAGALPGIALHHALTFWLSGGFAPSNTVAAFLDWPGSPFSDRVMTGRWNHSSVWHFLSYAIQLLVGRRGFVLHNLPLLVAAIGFAGLARQPQRVAEWPTLRSAATLSIGSWITYAALSTNYSGDAASIRWFVPLLAPGFWVIAVWLRERPGWWPAFAGLSAWGAILGALLWFQGPWVGSLAPFFWGWIACALITCWLTRPARIAAVKS